MGNWKENGNVIPNASGTTYSFTVDGNRTITVEFIEITNVDVYAWIKYGQAPEDISQLTASDITSKPHVTVTNVQTDLLYGFQNSIQQQTERLTGWGCAAIPAAFGHWATDNQDPEYNYATFFVGEAQGGGCDLLGASQTRTMTINNIPYIVVETPQSLSLSSQNSIIFGGGKSYLNEYEQLPQFGTLWSHQNMNIIDIDRVSSEQNNG
jgi:hypothetical protein